MIVGHSETELSCKRLIVSKRVFENDLKSYLTIL